MKKRLLAFMTYSIVHTMFLTSQAYADSEAKEAYLRFKNAFEGAGMISQNGNEFRLRSSVSLGSYQPTKTDYCQPVITNKVINTNVDGRIQWDLTTIAGSLISERVTIGLGLYVSSRGSQDSTLISKLIAFESELLYQDTTDFLEGSTDSGFDLDYVVLYSVNPVEEIQESYEYYRTVCIES